MNEDPFLPQMSETFFSEQHRLKLFNALHFPVQGFTLFIRYLYIEWGMAKKAYLFKALKDFSSPRWAMFPEFRWKGNCHML